VSLRPETFLAVAVDILEQCALDGLRRFVLLNAHYENAALLREASRRLCSRYREARVLFCNWWDIPARQDIIDLYPTGAFPGMELEHGGLLETSMMLQLFPKSVGAPESFPDQLCRPPGFEIFPERPPTASASGALAPADRASAEIGAKLCRLVVHGILEAVRDALPEI
jgi:creatinine amidohydrolase